MIAWPQGTVNAFEKSVYYHSQEEREHHTMQSNQKEAPEFARRQMEWGKGMAKSHYYYGGGKLLGGNISYWARRKKKTDVKVCGKSFLKWFLCTYENAEMV